MNWTKIINHKPVFRQKIVHFFMNFNHYQSARIWSLTPNWPTKTRHQNKQTSDNTEKFKTSLYFCRSQHHHGIRGRVSNRGCLSLALGTSNSFSEAALQITSTCSSRETTITVLWQKLYLVLRTGKILMKLNHLDLDTRGLLKYKRVRIKK